MTSSTDMLTVAAVRAELARLTYKPGWRFWVLSKDLLAQAADLVLLIGAALPDSRHPDRTTDVTALYPIPRDLPLSELLNWVHGFAVAQVEMHERDEWFLIDGQRIYDPHKEGTT